MAASRRVFLSRVTTLGLALSAAPERLFATLRQPRTRSAPANAAGRSDAEFWEEVRAQFLIPREEAFFNTGTLGASPRPVLEAVIDHMRHVDRDIAHWDYKAGHENYFTGYYAEEGVRAKLASLIHADVSEVALTQNATFGMNFIANGLDLGLGDEVIVMNGAHPGGRCGWELRDKRYGAQVKLVTPPVPPKEPAELIELYERATTPQTRVWAIPHLTSGTAIRFPVEELCRRARARGILSVVDGAQTLGHLAIDVRSLGCDVFFSSPHKWLLAPKGTGLLYIRGEVQPRIWSTLASSEWDNHASGAYRLMQYGTGNLSLLVGLEKAIDFHVGIGSARVEERVLSLANRLRAGLQRTARVRITSPLHPALLSATTIWQVEGMSGEQVQDALWERAKVRVRSMGAGVRQCCHIYNSEAEVDRTLSTLARVVA